MSPLPVASPGKSYERYGPRLWGTWNPLRIYQNLRQSGYGQLFQPFVRIKSICFASEKLGGILRSQGKEQSLKIVLELEFLTLKMPLVFFLAAIQTSASLALNTEPGQPWESQRSRFPFQHDVQDWLVTGKFDLKGTSWVARGNKSQGGCWRQSLCGFGFSEENEH